MTGVQTCALPISSAGSSAAFKPHPCPGMAMTRTMPASSLAASGTGTSAEVEVDVGGKTLLEAQDALQNAVDSLGSASQGGAMMPMVQAISSRSVTVTITPCTTGAASSTLTEQLRQSLQNAPSFEIRGSYLQRNNVILGR